MLAILIRDILSPMQSLKLQFIAASATPNAPLGIAEELQTIQRRLDHYPQEAAIIYPATNAHWSDVTRVLDRNRPNVVHFSAHGTPMSRLILLDDKNQPIEIPRRAMQQAFTSLKNDVRLVVLSACYSEEQAKQIAEIVDYVIGIPESIPVETALVYSAEFYDVLAGGSSVNHAHQRGLTHALVTVEIDRCPRLLTREGVDCDVEFISNTRIPLSVTLQPNVTHQKPTAKTKKWMVQKRKKFLSNQNRYGVWATEFSVTKRCFGDGSSVLVYELRGLQTKNKKVSNIYFGGESTAGVVSSPKIDQRGEALAIKWKSLEEPAARNIQDVIDQVRIVRGFFRLGQSLNGTNRTDSNVGPYTFGWSVSMLNCDAVTRWDYYNLYERKEQKHIDDTDLDDAKEYFARLIWFPVKRFSIRLDLSELAVGNELYPVMRYFQLAGTPELPVSEVISDGNLWCIPKPNSIWRQQNARYEANLKIQTLEQHALTTESRGITTLTIEYPPLGSYFSIDWTVPSDPPFPNKIEPFVYEAEVIRAGLIAHRENRKNDKCREGSSLKICTLFRGLHEVICHEHRALSPQEEFETAFITYDQERHRLVMVEGYVNDNVLPEEAWDFSLPFGMGLAGACFREGGRAFRYQRGLDAFDPDEPEPYLPMPPARAKECLLVLPIDHPKLTDADLNGSKFHRSRQLVGVVAISSTYRASLLRPLCRRDLAEEQYQALTLLREKCQAACDNISFAVLS